MEITCRACLVMSTRSYLQNNIKTRDGNHQQSLPCYVNQVISTKQHQDKAWKSPAEPALLCQPGHIYKTTSRQCVEITCRACLVMSTRSYLQNNIKTRHGNHQQSLPCYVNQVISTKQHQDNAWKSPAEPALLCQPGHIYKTTSRQCVEITSRACLVMSTRSYLQNNIKTMRGNHLQSLPCYVNQVISTKQHQDNAWKSPAEPALLCQPGHIYKTTSRQGMEITSRACLVMSTRSYLQNNIKTRHGNHQQSLPCYVNQVISTKQHQDNAWKSPEEPALLCQPGHIYKTTSRQGMEITSRACLVMSTRSYLQNNIKTMRGNHQQSLPCYVNQVISTKQHQDKAWKSPAELALLCQPGHIYKTTSRQCVEITSRACLVMSTRSYLQNNIKTMRGNHLQSLPCYVNQVISTKQHQDKAWKSPAEPALLCRPGHIYKTTSRQGMEISCRACLVMSTRSYLQNNIKHFCFTSVTFNVLDLLVPRSINL